MLIERSCRCRCRGCLQAAFERSASGFGPQPREEIAGFLLTAARPLAERGYSTLKWKRSCRWPRAGSTSARDAGGRARVLANGRADSLAAATSGSEHPEESRPRPASRFD